MQRSSPTAPSPSSDYEKLLRGEISSKQYVKAVEDRLASRSRTAASPARPLHAQAT